MKFFLQIVNDKFNFAHANKMLYATDTPTLSLGYQSFLFSFSLKYPIPIQLSASLQRSKTSTPMSILDMALNNLMVWLQSWNFGECALLLYRYYSQVLSDPKWSYLIGSYLWVK